VAAPVGAFNVFCGCVILTVPVSLHIELVRVRSCITLAIQAIYLEGGVSGREDLEGDDNRDALAPIGPKDSKAVMKRPAGP